MPFPVIQSLEPETDPGQVLKNNQLIRDQFNRFMGPVRYPASPATGGLNVYYNPKFGGQDGLLKWRMKGDIYHGEYLPKGTNNWEPMALPTETYAPAIDKAIGTNPLDPFSGQAWKGTGPNGE